MRCPLITRPSSFKRDSEIKRGLNFFFKKESFVGLFIKKTTSVGSGGGIIPACKLASRVFCVTAAQKASLKGECGQPIRCSKKRGGGGGRPAVKSEA